jgi:RHS repeat-associated protein
MLNLTYEYGTAAGNDGRIKKINDLVVPDRTVNFEYDGLARLQRAYTAGGQAYAAWDRSWTYDGFGNRTSQTVVGEDPPVTSLSFDAATNRVTSTGWTHDAAGNVTATPDGTFSIDAAGRVVGHTPGADPPITFAFDATGLRTKRTEGSSTTLYLRDGGQVVGEWNGTSWTKEYVWLGSTLLATIEGSTIKYHHQDHLSIRATTFADGMVGEGQGHYPFGEPWYETSPETTRIFTTYEREAGGSLDYAMFRWMGPEAGRFLSADPIPGRTGDGQSWNRYAYAGNDPVNRWDPWGLFFTDAGSPEVNSLFDPITGASGAGGGSGGGGDECYWQCIEVEPNKFICICVPPVDVTVEADDPGPPRDGDAEINGWLRVTDELLGLVPGAKYLLHRGGRMGGRRPGACGSEPSLPNFSFGNTSRNTYNAVSTSVRHDGNLLASAKWIHAVAPGLRGAYNWHSVNNQAGGNANFGVTGTALGVPALALQIGGFVAGLPQAVLRGETLSNIVINGAEDAVNTQQGIEWARWMTCRLAERGYKP